MKEFFYSIPDWVWWLLGIMLVIKMLANVVGSRSPEKLGAIVALLENIDGNLIKIGNRLDNLDQLGRLSFKLDDLGRHLEKLDDISGKLDVLESLEELEKLDEIGRNTKGLLDEIDWRAKGGHAIDETFGRTVVASLDEVHQEQIGITNRLREVLAIIKH